MNNYLKRILNKGTEITKCEETDHIDYPAGSIVEEVEKIVKAYPENYAIEYYGRSLTYQKFYNKIETCAKGLKALGVEKGDKVTICMPNMPEAVIMIYAVNMIGAVSSMIHPLASVNEIEYYLDAAKSKYVLTVDMFADKVIEASRRVNVNKIILTKITEFMSLPMKGVLSLYNGVNDYVKKKEKVSYSGDDIISWTDFMLLGYEYKKNYKVKLKDKDEAVILYSGGTTGKPKGVRLSNLNLNALAMQCAKATGAYVGDSVLVILPIFHGFGLAVSVHAPLINGLRCVLIPRFKNDEFAKLIKKYKPSFLTGVPTMYEALTQNEDNSMYLKCVRNVICGGDLLQPQLQEKVNKYLSSHGSKAQIRLGYGLTESTAACVLTPNYFFKENCVGKALPDTKIQIVKEGTTREVKYNRVGEICISGPTVMLGYLNESEETKDTLKVHDDGNVYLHTGDLGYITKDGFVYFKSRLKRMIVTSGYNIYPTIMEKIIMEHPAVENVVVVGIPHPYKKQVPIACIKLKDNFKESKELTMDIKEFCEKSIAKYSMPYRYHYIKSVPKTLIGKINYKKLEEECFRKYGKK